LPDLIIAQVCAHWYSIPFEPEQFPFNADPTNLAVNEDGVSSVISTETGSIRWQSESDEYSSVVVSPDGNLIGLGCDSSIKIRSTRGEASLVKMVLSAAKRAILHSRISCDGKVRFCNDGCCFQLLDIGKAQNIDN
jgi:hypothetical protein